MLNHRDLVKLFRELREERVLSVYLDGWSGDFSELNLWRRRFEHEVSDVRDRLSDRESDEVRAFEAAVGEVASALEAYERFLPDQGWVGFATSDRLVYGEPVRVPMPNLIRWEFGIRVAPYVRALKQDRLVVAVLVDSRRARVFEYREGVINESMDLLAETFLGG